MRNFQTTIQFYYLNNYYHNSLHAADVTNTVVFLLSCGIREHLDDVCFLFYKSKNQLEFYSLIIGATVHDVGHPGYNGPLLCTQKTIHAYICKVFIQLKNLGNDQSPLENYHSFLTFRIISKEENNILKNLSEDMQKKFRKLLIQIILDTDLAKHFQILKKFENSLDDNNFDLKKNENKLELMSIVLKTAGRFF